MSVPIGAVCEIVVLSLGTMLMAIGIGKEVGGGDVVKTCSSHSLQLAPPRISNPDLAVAVDLDHIGSMITAGDPNKRAVQHQVPARTIGSTKTPNAIY